jgi:hypothetical protein
MASEAVLVCKGCDRQLEVCAFCEAEDCGDATCYRCLVADLGETVAHPHEHGG